MSIEYKRLSTGYHYACETAAFHRFAQWPIGSELTAEHVSHNGLSDADIEAFIRDVREATHCRVEM
jgi:hypothetical protein